MSRMIESPTVRLKLFLSVCTYRELPSTVYVYSLRLLPPSHVNFLFILN